MKPKQCSLCKGSLGKGKTDFTTKVDQRIISILDVPAYVCDNCGEAYFTPESSKLIDKALLKFSKSAFPLYPVSAGEIPFKEVAHLA